MKESTRCVPLSKRDYDVANALHIEAYGEPLPTVTCVPQYVNVHHDKCPRCLEHCVHDGDSYCSRCGAELQKGEVER